MRRKSIFKSIPALAAALLMAVTAVFGAALPGWAADDGGGGGTGRITIQPNGQALEPGDRFQAYQIFKGQPGENKTLDNLSWGDGVNSQDFLDGLKSSDVSVGGSTFGELFTKAYDEWTKKHTGSGDAAEFVAQWLSDQVNSPEIPEIFARVAGEHTGDVSTPSAIVGGSWVIDNLDPGYYLVVDTYQAEDNADEGHQNDGAASSYILQVVGTVTVDLKATVPTVEKKVEGQDGYLAGTEQQVHYTLTGTISENIAQYDTYSYKFIDNLSAGLTLTEEDVKNLTVELRSTAEFFTYPYTFAADKDYTAVAVPKGDGTGTTLTVEFKDLKKSIVDAWNQLVEEGVWLTIPNLSAPGVTSRITVVVSYTAELNENAVVGAEGNPNDVTLEYSNDPYSEGTGQTVPDEVKTYTLGVKIHKVDEKDQPMAGIGFKLKDSQGRYAAAKHVAAGESAQYPEEEFDEITGWAEGETGGSTFTTDAQGEINIHGLTPGTYTLEETEAREGYLPMEPVTFTIVAEGGDDADGDGVADSTGELSGGIVVEEGEGREDAVWTDGVFDLTPAALTVRNFPVPELPHTGGVGRMAVIAGGALVLLIGGGVVLFALRGKKKKGGA